MLRSWIYNSLTLFQLCLARELDIETASVAGGCKDLGGESHISSGITTCACFHTPITASEFSEYIHLPKFWPQSLKMRKPRDAEVQ